jgi:hypothetical protein
MPSSMRLEELWLCLWWGHIMDQRGRRDTPRGPIGQCQSRGLTTWDWQLSSHKDNGV